MDILDVKYSTSENKAILDVKTLHTYATPVELTEEFKEKRRKSESAVSKLEKILTPEQKVAFGDVYDALYDEFGQGEDEEFIKGFKIAVRLLLDCCR